MVNQVMLLSDGGFGPTLKFTEAVKSEAADPGGPQSAPFQLTTGIFAFMACCRTDFPLSQSNALIAIPFACAATACCTHAASIVESSLESHSVTFQPRTFAASSKFVACSAHEA